MTGALLASGCTTSQTTNPHVHMPTRHLEARGPLWDRLSSLSFDRPESRFHSADFFKPNADETRGVAPELAPLIVQQISKAVSQVDHGARFGALHVVGRDWWVDADRPTVYFDSSTAVLQAKPYRQLVFSWVYAKTACNFGSQGVRMTLDAEGFPFIWEVAHGFGGVKHIYIARSLEEAAADQFGPPLPGRRYSIEAGLSQCPDAVVARVLDDGPIPMGPFVYLDDHCNTVRTLICRCMPAQVDEFVHTVYYDLVPVEETHGFESVGLGARSLTVAALIKWRIDSGWLERCLRLPKLN
ncbi:MAG: hypothetical protein V3W34_20240 [Phycisphaerae bacterium]